MKRTNLKAVYLGNTVELNNKKTYNLSIKQGLVPSTDKIFNYGHVKGLVAVVTTGNGKIISIPYRKKDWNIKENNA